jgi:hypothetical protein
MNRVAGEPFENLGAAGDLLVKMGHPAEAAEFYALRVKAVPWDAEAHLKLAKAEAAAKSQGSDAIQLLTSVASSPRADYSTRAEAAQSLETVKAPAPSLGSAELDWLVKGGPMAAAESPGFFYARLRAAQQASDAAAKIHLLLDAIAIHPEDFTQHDEEPPPAAPKPKGVSPRILLFQAAIVANQNELALSAVTPLMDPGITISPPPVSPENEASSEETEQPRRSYVEAAFLSGQQLDVSQKSLIAAQMAGAFHKLHRLEEAARLWKVAWLLATEDSLRSQASQRREQIEAQLKIEKADQARRPVITEHLEQQGLVRPRLLGRSGPSAGAGAGGAGQ